MTFVIAEPCVGTCDTACVDVCPVDCIHGPYDPYGAGAEVHEMSDEEKQGKQLYINPEECVDCAACVPVCPPKAIFDEPDVPPEWAHYTKINADWFQEHDA